MQRIAMWQVRRWRVPEAVMHTITYSRTLLVICGKGRRDMKDRRRELIEYYCNSDEDKIVSLPK